MDSDEDWSSTLGGGGGDSSAITTQQQRRHRNAYDSLIGRTFDDWKEARQAIKTCCAVASLPFGVKYASNVVYCLCCPKTIKSKKKRKPTQRAKQVQEEADANEEEEDAEEEEDEDQEGNDEDNEEDYDGVPETCDFIVTARFQKKTGCIKVIQCHLDHSCGIMLEGATSGATLQGQWVTGHVNALLNDVPDASPAALRSHMVRRFGVTPSYHMAWRAAWAIRKSLNSDEVIAFQLVQPLFSKLEQVMPGTVAVLERDLECRLLRTFVMLAPLMDALLHCKPILSFDACALKGTYKGILMAATMMDGAGQILPLAWGTAQIENGENWMWFAEKLRHGLPTRQQEIAFTVFSDREKGIESERNSTLGSLKISRRQ